MHIHRPGDVAPIVRPHASEPAATRAVIDVIEGWTILAGQLPLQRFGEARNQPVIANGV